MHLALIFHQTPCTLPCTLIVSTVFYSSASRKVCVRIRDPGSAQPCGNDSTESRSRHVLSAQGSPGKTPPALPEQRGYSHVCLARE